MGRLKQRKEKAEKVLAAMATYWQSYGQLKDKTGLSRGAISSLIWNNDAGLRDKIEYRRERFGNEEWETRDLFKIKPVPPTS